MGLIFIYPKFLFFLLVIPLLFLIHFLSLRAYKSKALRFANFEAIARIKGVEFYSKNLVILILTCLLLLVIIFASAGLTLKTEVEASSFSFVMAIDSSASMGANDLLPTRLDAARETALQFVSSSPISTYFSVISFNSAARLEQDVTENKEIVSMALKDVKLSSSGGTNLYDAVVLGVNILREYDNKSMILLSDGQVNIGNLQEAIDYANDNNLIIHTIAIGTEEGGESTYGLTKVDEESLQAISYNTKGSYFKAEDKEAIANAFSKIADLKMKRVSIPLSSYLFSLSILLIVVIYYLANSRYRTIP